MGVVVLTLATTGAALVSAAQPGATTTTDMGGVVSVVNTGTARVDLGPAPRGARSVQIYLTCVSKAGFVGTKTNDGSVGGDCGAEASTPETSNITNGALPAPGTTFITITATAGTTWRATAAYASATIAPWSKNAHGQTLGSPNANGMPDLIPARATNGKVGYISSQAMASTRSSDVNVYESDGTTVIGTFNMGGMAGGSGKVSTNVTCAWCGALIDWMTSQDPK
jgi:hypothetical protein